MKAVLTIIIGFLLVTFADITKLSLLPFGINNTVSSLASTKFAKLVIIFLPYIVVIAIEILLKSSRQRLFRSSSQSSQAPRFLLASKQVRRDAIYFIFSLLNMPIIVLAIYTLGSHNLVSSISPVLSDQLKILALHLTNANTFVLSLFLITGFIISELSSYLRHLVLHRNSILWKSHEFHHSSTFLNVFTIARNANSDNIPNLFVLPISLAGAVITSACLLSAKPIVLAIYIFYMLIHNINNYLGHSSVFYKHPFPLNLIFMSPYHHWIHHSSHPDHHCCNLNTTFALWDRVFSTYIDLAREEAFAIKYGVENSSYNQHNVLFEFFFLPYLLIYRQILGKINMSSNLCLRRGMHES